MASSIEIRIIDDSNKDISNIEQHPPSSESESKNDVPNDQKNSGTNKYGRVIISLDNPVLSDEMLQNTPSMADGLDRMTENDLRITGCRLIQISGILLRLPQVAMATGQVLFQRYYYSKSFVRFPMEITAMGCLVLASKVEEAPRRTRDVINVFHNMKQIRLQQPIVPVMLDENYVSIKNQLIKAERRILKELGFCVHVKHPHKFIVTVAQILNNETNTDLIQASWSYMNDSLQTDVFLRYSPEAIACACIHLSARVLRVPLPEDPAWYLLFGIEQATIDSICHSILCLYSRTATSQEVLEAIVADVRQKFEAAKAEARKAMHLEAASKYASSAASSNLLHGIENSLDSIDSRTNSPNDLLGSSRSKNPNSQNNLEQLSIKNRIGNKIKSAIRVINSGGGGGEDSCINVDDSTTPDTPIRLQKSPLIQPGSRKSSRSPRKDDYRENYNNRHNNDDGDRNYSDGSENDYHRDRQRRRASPEDDDVTKLSGRNSSRYKNGSGTNSRSYDDHRDVDDYQNGHNEDDNNYRRSYNHRSPPSPSSNLRPNYHRDDHHHQTSSAVKHRRRSRSPIRPPSDDSYNSNNNKNNNHSYNKGSVDHRNNSDYRRSRDVVDDNRYSSAGGQSRRTGGGGHRSTADDYYDDPRPQYNKRSRISPPPQPPTSKNAHRDDDYYDNSNYRHRSRSPPLAYSSSKYNQHSSSKSSSSNNYRNRTKY